MHLEIGIAILERDRHKIAGKLKVATEEWEVLRKSVTESMTTEERAEEVLRQSEEQRKGAEDDEQKTNRLNEQISQFRNVREQATGSAVKIQQHR